MRTLAFGLLLTVAACSSNALKPDGGSPGDAADAPASETGDDTAPVGGSCGRTNDRATITLQLPGGDTLSCANPTPDGGVTSNNPQTWIGKVTASTATSLVLAVEECGDDGGCAPGSTLRIEATAPGLDLTAFPHTWVLVKAKVARFRACQQWLEIETATPLDGSTPAEPAGQLLLAVVDGWSTLPDSRYTAAHTRLPCPGIDAGSPCGGGAGTYAFDFASAEGQSVALRAYMGETKTWSLGSRSFRVRNLRSYETGNCDDYWNWAYTISLAP